MKKLFFRLFLTSFINASLAGCIAPREVNQSACLDPEYLRLKAILTDSMTPREYAYYTLKDKECEDAYIGASVEHQRETWRQENVFLYIGFVAVAIAFYLLAGSQ
jgi:hypothetical protein